MLQEELLLQLLTAIVESPRGQAHTPKAAQNSLNECKVLSVFSEDKIPPSNDKSSMVCCTLGAMPEFCSHKTLLMVTPDAKILAESSITSGASYNEVLATKQPSKMNLNSFLDISGNLSMNLNLAAQLTVIFGEPDGSR